ncbi:MAG: tRNA uridine-5-carboxymethylaminomethyl(34) synthesis enzyme MnmG [Alistipes sp.]|jgi:tRNA uridine 5-carboxymethylaminomethyl modification enzyme|nr:tRNA uridine-5-carboxymethylaminomethyl(34) synthesis enzyme MnmG [Alistipes sp.]
MRLDYDIIVVGAGHAGCEAAVAAARLGSRVLLITMDLEKVAAMSCNPAVGGVAKGQIVREIDALGGRMGVITDRSTIQFRMLGRSKGAAMWSPRAQCDKARFSALWRAELERTPGLSLWQDSVVDLMVSEEGENRSVLGAHDRDFFEAKEASACLSRQITGVRTALGVEFTARAVVLTAGTFLGGLIHVGRAQMEGGRIGEKASKGLTERLVELGFEAGRMKTGTPARIDGRTIDFGRLERQEGDTEPSKFPFSDETEPVPLCEQLPCYIANTSPEVHDVLRGGFADSPLFNGIIRGVGPRYCPSIEDKLRTFADKSSHQLFLEPEGVTTNEYYLNGFSSSLPWAVQMEALSRISGLEEAQFFRPGYAIEYDYFPPTQLTHTLQTKLIPNLWFAGQINGTTGYEEAAAQGLIAGINAHLAVTGATSGPLEVAEAKGAAAGAAVAEKAGRETGVGREPFVLRRDEAYIGVLIDDLVTKGVDEPYRMFTSRAEYRILLRQDNADLRLTPRGREIGLVDDARWRLFEQKKSNVESLRSFVHGLSIAPDDLRDYLISRNSALLTQGRKLSFLISRGEVSLREVAEVLPALRDFVASLRISVEEIEQVEIEIKYRGYIEREKLIAEKLARLENVAVPAGFDFHSLGSLTMEARQKLSRIRPSTIGQASRIPGVSPADINVLLVFFGR